MVSRAERDRREATTRFAELYPVAKVTHVRVGGERLDQTRVSLLMTAAQAHGLDGVCTCCPRRPAGEPTAAEQAAAEARAIAHRVALDRPVDQPIPILAEALPVPEVETQVSPRAAAIAEARSAAAAAADERGPRW